MDDVSLNAKTDAKVTKPQPQSQPQAQQLQPQSKKIGARIREHLLRKEHDPVAKPTTTPARSQPSQSPNMPKNKPATSIQQLPSKKPLSPHTEEEIAGLNREAEKLQRGWSVDNNEVKTDNYPAHVNLRPESAQGSTFIARKPTNSHNNQIAIPSTFSEDNGRGAIPLSLRNGTEMKVARPVYSEPETVDDDSLIAIKPDGASHASFNHEQNSVPPAHKGKRSHSYERLRSELDAAKHRNEALQKQLHLAQQSTEQARYLVAELEALRRFHKEHLRDMDYIQEENHGFKVNAARLNEENLKLQEDATTWRERFDYANNDLLQLRSDLTSASKVDDKWFVTQWNDLHVKIELLSNQYFLGRLSKLPNSMLHRVKGSRPDKLEHQPGVFLTRLSSSFARYLKSDQDRPQLIRAFLWSVLVNDMFDHLYCWDGGFYWAGQSREIIYHLHLDVKPCRPRRRKDATPLAPSDVQRLENATHNYHRWRAETANLLLTQEPIQKRVTNISSIIVNLVADIYSTLEPYVVTSKDRPLNAAEPDIRHQLRIILIQAIEMDAEMARQRAWIYCEQWRAMIEGDPFWGFPWSPDDMDKVATTEQGKSGRTSLKSPCVDLIIQPALYKEGNQYGEGYGERQILCKAKVIVGEDPTLPGSRH